MNNTFSWSNIDELTISYLFLIAILLLIIFIYTFFWFLINNIWKYLIVYFRTDLFVEYLKDYFKSYKIEYFDIFNPCILLVIIIVGGFFFVGFGLYFQYYGITLTSTLQIIAILLVPVGLIIQQPVNTAYETYHLNKNFNINKKYKFFYKNDPDILYIYGEFQSSKGGFFNVKNCIKKVKKRCIFNYDNFNGLTKLINENQLKIELRINKFKKYWIPCPGDEEYVLIYENLLNIPIFEVKDNIWYEVEYNEYFDALIKIFIKIFKKNDVIKSNMKLEIYNETDSEYDTDNINIPLMKSKKIFNKYLIKQ